MKNFLLLFCSIFLLSTISKKEETKTTNLITFAKAYGYVKYFHPSHEAANIDWNSFSVLGAEHVSKCKNQTELIAVLNKLFKPIAPGIVFADSQQDYDLKSITPENPSDYQATYWQHKGVSTGMSRPGQVYSSVRVNQISKIDESDNFGNLTTVLSPEKYKGKKIKYTGWVKLGKGSKGTGHLWRRVDKSDKTPGFFNNMGANPVKSTEWQQYEIIGEVDELASDILVGAFMLGKGTIYLDDVALYYQENDEWVEIPVKNSDFEQVEIGMRGEHSEWSGSSAGYTYNVSTTENKEGKSCAVIAYEGKFKEVKGSSLFGDYPKFGTLVEKEIGKDVFCQIPMNLYGNSEGTYPKSNSINGLNEELNKTSEDPSELSVRIGNIINVYNVFQHFYPYFEEVNVDWEKELSIAINRSYLDTSSEDHLITLEKMTAALKDGHISVRGNNAGWHKPGIRWEWIEEKLIITEVSDQNLALKIGDEITKVNDLPVAEFLKEVRSRISAGTNGYLNHRAKLTSLLGQENSKFTIEVEGKKNYFRTGS